MSIVYQSGDIERGLHWQNLYRRVKPERRFHIWPECTDLDAVRYLITWQPPVDLLSHFPNLQVLFSIGAGVDQIDLATVPNEIPIVRMIDPGLTQGMVEYVSCALLALHRDFPLYLQQQHNHVWQPHDQRTTTGTTVGVMGLGELGRAVLEQVQRFGFRCQGWSRSERKIGNIRTYGGADSLFDFLSTTDILVCLLPLTADTREILDMTLFSALPEGAALIHVGRGAQLVSADLITALECEHLKAAVIDVVDPEPLPGNHPLWQQEKVWLTPHIASSTQADSGFESIYKNIVRFENQQPMIGVVDRQRGY